MGWLAHLREDISVARQRDPAARSSFEILLTYPGIHALFIHRIAHGLAVRGWVVLPRLIAHLGRALTGIEIHPRAEIGRRLFIDHGMGIVIGETAVIGDDCHLYQGVTLGGTSTRREKRHPTLEDHVTVGAGAIIIGAVTLGTHARIGAGSVVVSNVPPHATVVGVPGHIVAITNATNDTVERLPDPEWDRLQDLERRVTRIEAGAPAPSPTGGGFDGGPPTTRPEERA
ncbi:MAG: serine O-acetyltransferase [Dehalococcoidia bacterium]|nr:serine O-acetyltransferase [Dehalococcoidia bacterium]